MCGSLQLQVLGAWRELTVFPRVIKHGSKLGFPRTVVFNYVSIKHQFRFSAGMVFISRSQWLPRLSRRFAAARSSELRVRIPPGSWLSLLVSVVICQVQVSSTGWLLFQRRPAECGGSECDYDTSTLRRPWHTSDCGAMEKIAFIGIRYQMIKNDLETNHVKEKIKNFWMFFHEKQLFYF